MSDFENLDNIQDTNDTVPETTDCTNQLPNIDNMSLDELYALRVALTGETSDETGNQTPNDYSFHWDGSPTHIEIDDTGDEQPDFPVKVLRR